PGEGLKVRATRAPKTHTCVRSPSSAEVVTVATSGLVRRFKVLLERDARDRVWVTYVPNLGNLSTFGDTREEALDQTREAILGYLETAGGSRRRGARRAALTLGLQE